KDVIAKMKAPNTTKSIIAAAYTAFLRWRKQTWNPPKIEISRKIPTIPSEGELDMLISACGRRTAAALQIAKETGLRVGEILRLKWSNIDFERRLIIFNEPEKGGESRIFKVSPRLLDMLNALPRKNERIFNTTRSSIASCLYLTRKRLAAKLKNPRFNKITFHTFRHWRATTLYHQTKDILLVKETLGHKKLDTSLLYIQLEKALYSPDSDEFYCATAKTSTEAAKLIETGFEYVCTTPEGIMLFRKRK
ncbi:MAG: site-specific integrase, partial [Nitrososphaerota archaeon]|nr:site-specific integrase [Candidatus Bathyarchaeota archaeon]MDW8194601.1 site-specific integrase [Nitrososphaerota archaeon]